MFLQKDIKRRETFTESITVKFCQESVMNCTKSESELLSQKFISKENKKTI